MDQILDLFRKITGFDCEITQTLHISPGFRSYQLRSRESLYVLELKKKPSEDSEKITHLYTKEGALLGRILNRFVTKTLAVGETDTEFYRIREDHDGTTLSAKLKGSPWSEIDLVRFLVIIAEILTEIHQYGLNLNQLNSKRIVFTSNDQFYLIDSIGLKSNFTPRDDLAALGLFLQENKSLRELRPSPDPKGLDFSNRLFLVIRRLTAHDPSISYLNARELLTDLNRVLDPYQPNFPPVEFPLFGILDKLSRIDFLREKMNHGSGSVIQVRGESGTGKTQFTKEATRKLKEGSALVIWGAGGPVSSPFAAIRSLLENYVNLILGLPEAHRTQHVQWVRESVGNYGPLFKGFAPGFSQILNEQREIGNIDDIEGVIPFFYDILVSFFSELSRKGAPLVLVLDDLQSLDVPSSEVILLLAKATQSNPILLILTSEPGFEILGLKSGPMVTLEMTPLSSQELVLHLRERLGAKEVDSEISQLLFQRSSGNPFVLGLFLDTLLREGRIEPSWEKWRFRLVQPTAPVLPESVDQLLFKQFSALPQRVQSLFLTAAWIGPVSHTRILSQVTEVPESEILQLMCEVTNSGFFTIDSSGWLTVSHAWIQNWLRTLISEDRLLELHFKIASAYERNLDSVFDSRFRVTHHLLESDVARHSRKVCEALFYSARESGHLFDFDDAYSQLVRSSQIAMENQWVPEAQFELLFGHICYQLQRLTEAHQHFSIALKLTEPKQERIPIYEKLADIHFCVWELQQSLSYLEKAYLESHDSPVEMPFTDLLIKEQKPISSALIPLLRRYQKLSFFQSSPSHWFEITSRLYPLVQEPKGVLNVQSLAQNKKLKAVLLLSQGQLPACQKLAYEIVHEDAVWLDRLDVLETFNILVFTCLLQGKAKDALSFLHHPNFKIYRRSGGGGAALSMNFPVGLKNWMICCWGLLGNEDESESTFRELEKFNQDLELDPDTSKFFKGLTYMARLWSLYEKNELGKDFDEIISSFEKLGFQPERVSPFYFPFYLVQAYGRLLLYFEASAQERPRALENFKKSLQDLKKLPAQSILVSHLKNFQSAVSMIEKEFDSAWLLACEAEKHALEAEDLWALLESLLQKSRIFENQGKRSAALQYLQLVLNLAHEQGWQPKISRVQREFRMKLPFPAKVPSPGRELESELILMEQGTSENLFKGSTQGYLDALMKINRERARLAKDLEVTGLVQALLLPKDEWVKTSAFHMASYYQAAHQSGGDWWWFEKEANGGLSLIIADVTGHGVGSAMVTATVASSYRTLTSLKGTDQGIDFSWLFDKMNSNLYAICEGSYGMTLSALQFTSDGQLKVWCAGAPPVMILKHASKTVNVKFLPSTSLGSPEFTVTQESFQLEKGDRIFVFTDGTYEFQTPSQPAFGLRGLKKLLATTQGQNAEQARQTIASQLGAEKSGAALSDDITFVLVDYI